MSLFIAKMRFCISTHYLKLGLSEFGALQTTDDIREALALTLPEWKKMLNGWELFELLPAPLPN